MVYGYVRVSTDRQAKSGLGMDFQQSAILAKYPEARICLDPDESGRSINRPALQRVLSIIREGDTLVVAKLDRLSRSIIDFATLLKRAKSEGWAIEILDMGVDTSTSAGKMMANVVAAFAEYETDMISQRTKDALAQAKLRGVRIGRPPSPAVPNATRLRIRGLRDEGRGFEAIARQLTKENVPTARGNPKWWASSVREICMGAAR